MVLLDLDRLSNSLEAPIRKWAVPHEPPATHSSVLCVCLSELDGFKDEHPSER
ncbi:hypothetical protein [Pajaroellobacter abortibovis]|uniref:hypothetical protein n=1 Tax=Pajaroellobacter abortibovis TaxID=1882918 RepID=UPI0012EC97EA|nr:hypothetical protein [Pajaroellobacter abortibovis]